MAWPQGLPTGDQRHSQELPTANRLGLAGSQLRGVPHILSYQSTGRVGQKHIAGELRGWVRTPTHLLSLGKLLGLVINVLVCVCVYICTHVCVCVQICVIVCVCVYKCVIVCVCVQICVIVCACVYKYV